MEQAQSNLSTEKKEQQPVSLICSLEIRWMVSTYVSKTPRPTMALLGPHAEPQSLAVL